MLVSLPREHYRCLIFLRSLGQLRSSDQEYKQRETAPTHKEWVYFIYFILLYKARVTKALTQHVLSKQQKIETTERTQKD